MFVGPTRANNLVALTLKLPETIFKLKSLETQKTNVALVVMDNYRTRLIVFVLFFVEFCAFHLITYD